MDDNHTTHLVIVHIHLLAIVWFRPSRWMHADERFTKPHSVHMSLTLHAERTHEAKDILLFLHRAISVLVCLRVVLTHFLVQRRYVVIQIIPPMEKRDCCIYSCPNSPPQQQREYFLS